MLNLSHLTIEAQIIESVDESAKLALVEGLGQISPTRMLNIPGNARNIFKSIYP